MPFLTTLVGRLNRKDYIVVIVVKKILYEVNEPKYCSFLKIWPH